MSRCPVGAIRRTDDGYYISCILCGRCAEVCPSKAIKTNRLGGLYLDKSRCTGCGVCAAVCPVDSIEMVDGYPRGICLNCGLCAEVCPVGARIKVENEEGLSKLLVAGEEAREEVGGAPETLTTLPRKREPAGSSKDYPGQIEGSI